jgi:hypothetical protein
LTSVVLLAVFAGGILIGIRSIPDLQRYLRMRNM